MPERPPQSQIDEATRYWELSAQRLRAGFLETLKALSRNNYCDGYPTSSFSEHRGGGELTPTEAAAQARWRATDLEAKAIRCYVAIERAFKAMADITAQIKAEDQSGDVALSEMANDAGGFCINCAKYNVQSVRERGRSAGRCEPCRRYRERHEGTDRPAGLVVACERRRRRVGTTTGTTCSCSPPSSTTRATRLCCGPAGASAADCGSPRVLTDTPSETA